MTSPAGVARWIAAKLGSAILVVWLVATVVFFAMRMTGDPLQAVLGGPGSQASAEAVEAAIAQYGFDKPLFVQYLLQLRDIATLDFGDSFAKHRPVAELIGEQIGATTLLAVLALAAAWVLALVGALLQAVVRGRAGRVVSAIVRGIEIVASVAPQFWLGAVMIMLFASTLRWLPATSAGNDPASLLMPVITLAVPIAGFLSQVSRDALDDADAAPFATTARARGAGEPRVLIRHTLRHAILPAISLSGWAFGGLLSGALVVEVLFARPGLGRLLQDAALGRDVPVMVGAIVMVALIYVVVMIATDALELVADPRLKRRRRSSPIVAVGS